MNEATPQPPPIYRTDILDLVERSTTQARYSLNQSMQLQNSFATVPGLDSLTNAVEALIGGLEALAILVKAEAPQ